MSRKVFLQVQHAGKSSDEFPEEDAHEVTRFQTGGFTAQQIRIAGRRMSYRSGAGWERRAQTGGLAGELELHVIYLTLTLRRCVVSRRPLRPGDHGEIESELPFRESSISAARQEN